MLLIGHHFNDSLQSRVRTAGLLRSVPAAAARAYAWRLNAVQHSHSLNIPAVASVSMTASFKQFCNREGSLDGHDTVPEGQGQRVLTLAPHLVDDGSYLQLHTHSMNESGCALYYH